MQSIWPSGQGKSLRAYRASDNKVDSKPSRG